MIKYCAGEWGWRDIDKVMQIFGGIGETLDMPIPHWYHMLRHARNRRGHLGDTPVRHGPWPAQRQRFVGSVTPTGLGYNSAESHGGSGNG